MSAVARRFGALEERPFRLLWSGQALSDIGNAMLPVALAFAVLQVTGSLSDLGLVLAAALVPRVLLLLAGGVWADRLPRQIVMLSADLVRALSQGGLALLLLTGSARLWHLLVAAVVYGVAQAFFGPASTGLVPETVAAARLQQANALVSLTRSTLNVAGPALAGVLVAAFEPGWVFALDAATFVASAVFLVALPLPRRNRAGTREAFVAQLADGWRELRARTWVSASIAYFSIWNLAIAPFFVLGPFIAREELDGASDWGLILAAGGVGAIAGSLISLRFRPRRPLRAGYIIGTLTALEPLALIRPLPTAGIAAAAAVAFGALTISNTLWLTALQEHVPREALSRVSAYDWMGSLVFMPIGYAVAGPLGEAIGLDATLWTAGALLAGASLAILAFPSVRNVRRFDPVPDAGLTVPRLTPQ